MTNRYLLPTKSHLFMTKLVFEIHFLSGILSNLEGETNDTD